MITFIYPGQGSQEPAMGAPWQDHPSWEIVYEVNEAVGRDVKQLLLEADAEELQQTRNAQIASFTMSMIVLDAITRVGIIPDSHAGHSLGEFSALAASGVLSLTDASQIVGERGEAMQMASEEKVGTMAAVLGLDDLEVEDLCKKLEAQEIWVANYNAPGQVVVAGSQAGIDQMVELAKEHGAKKVMPLKVGGAFHTPYMESAQDRLEKAIAQIEFRHPDSAIYANVDATAYEHSAPWPDLIAAQLTSPVQWHSILKQLANDGAETLVEVGAGKALTAMAKRVKNAEFQLIAVHLPEHIDKLLEILGHPPASVGHGEHLYATERLIVSPRTGIFEPVGDLEIGDEISVGILLGHVSDEEVRSPFAGKIMGYMALKNERVNINQPLAWLQTTD